jgi:hypothetical protein
MLSPFFVDKTALRLRFGVGAGCLPVAIGPHDEASRRGQPAREGSAAESPVLGPSHPDRRCLRMPITIASTVSAPTVSEDFLNEHYTPP